MTFILPLELFYIFLVPKCTLPLEIFFFFSSLISCSTLLLVEILAKLLKIPGLILSFQEIGIFLFVWQDWNDTLPARLRLHVTLFAITDAILCNNFHGKRTQQLWSIPVKKKKENTSHVQLGSSASSYVLLQLSCRGPVVVAVPAAVTGHLLYLLVSLESSNTDWLSDSTPFHSFSDYNSSHYSTPTFVFAVCLFSTDTGSKVKDKIVQNERRFVLFLEKWNERETKIREEYSRQ